MIPLDQVELAPLEFKKDSDASHKIKIQGNNIGWLHSVSDKPGAQFDVVIKDGLGRVKHRSTIKGGTEKSGALINLPTVLGEELEVSVENMKNADKVQLFIN